MNFYPQILNQNNTRRNKINQFMKIQNITLNRIDAYRVQKYWNDQDLLQLERKRRKSWTKGHEGQKYTILSMRAMIHEEDVKVLNKIRPKYERYNSYNVAGKIGLSLENSPLFSSSVRGLMKKLPHGKSQKTLFMKQ